MSDVPVEIIKLLSVTLSREKQLLIEQDFKTYSDATNYAIKSILKRRIPNVAKAEEILFDDITNRFVIKAEGDTTESEQSAFGRRFKYSMIAEHVPQQVKVATEEQGMRVISRTPDEVRQVFVHQFSKQYVRDIVRSAAAEISRHRKLAKTLVNIRGKIPHFKHGTIILSGMLVKVDEKAVEMLTLSGEPVPIPFDKRSRNREIDILQELAEQKRRYERVRITLNKEGFLNIDIRVKK
ncbi:MAG: hypothetical protein ACFFED_00570 [Candidatus Thorarchaeota archaeon]